MSCNHLPYQTWLYQHKMCFVYVEQIVTAGTDCLCLCSHCLHHSFRTLNLMNDFFCSTSKRPSNELINGEVTFNVVAFSRRATPLLSQSDYIYETLVHLTGIEPAFSTPVTVTRFVVLLGYRCIAEAEGVEPPSPCGTTVFKTA